MTKISFQKYPLIILFLLIAITTLGKSISYTPKPLYKDLTKLWGVNVSELIELSNLSEQLVKEGKFFKIEGKGFVFIGRVNSCRAGGCCNELSQSDNDAYEYFDIYIIYDINKVVQTVRVFNYQATHGHEISSKGWLKQFIGYDGGTKYQVGKEVDSISGATISVYAITDEVNYISELLKSHN